MKIQYSIGVKTPAGWREARVTADANRVSEKMAVVTAVTDINGDGNSGWASLTGAKRQQYSVGFFAGREVGKKKRLSACAIIAE